MQTGFGAGERHAGYLALDARQCGCRIGGSAANRLPFLAVTGVHLLFLFGHTHPFGYAQSKRYADVHTHCYADGYAHCYTDGHAYCHADGDLWGAWRRLRER